MCSAKGPVKHHFINHLISTRNTIFNQYNVFFICSGVPIRVLQKNRHVPGQAFSSCFMKSPGQVGHLSVESPLLTVKAGNLRCFDPALLSTPGSAVCSAGRAGPSQYSVGPGQRLPNVQAGVLLPPRGSCCPLLPLRPATGTGEKC